MSLEKLIAQMDARPVASKTVRINSSDLDGAQLKACVDWIKSLGLDPGKLRAVFAFVRQDGGWELHLSRYLPSPTGQKRWLDVASEDLVSEPVVVQLGASPTLPDFDVKAFVS